MVEGTRPRRAGALSLISERTPLPTRSQSLYSDRYSWFLWQIRHFRANMQTPSILTLSLMALLLGGSWAGLRSIQAQQDPPPAAETPAKETSSDEAAKALHLSESTPEEAAQANTLLQEARTSLLNRQSLQADMQQQIIVGDRRIKAEGTYSSGAFPKLRLEYKVRVCTMQGALTEICDGTILHTQKSIGMVGAKDPDVAFTRRDVQKILSATENSANLPVASLGAEMGIGGLPALLASIDRCMVGKRITEEEFEGQMCRVFHGSWDQAVLQRYNAGLQESKASLVPFFPDTVRVFFTADTLLPVKIVYNKHDQDESGKVTGERTLMTLEFRHWKLDQPAPPTAFRFTLPPGREEVDTTQDFLQLIAAANASMQGAPAAPKK